jgi:hypothetical protein
MMTRPVDPEPKRCGICDVRLHRAEPGHEDNHIRAEQAKAANARRAGDATAAAIPAMEAAHGR